MTTNKHYHLYIDGLLYLFWLLKCQLVANLLTMPQKVLETTFSSCYLLIYFFNKI